MRTDETLRDDDPDIALFSILGAEGTDASRAKSDVPVMIRDWRTGDTYTAWVVF